MKDEASRVVSSLERTFDVPFAETNGTSPSRWRVITPKNRMENLFSVRIQWRGAIRLIAELKPQRYAAAFVRSMGLASEEQRNDFASVIEVMKRRSSRVLMSVNGQPVDPADIGTWPSRDTLWHDVALRAEVVVPYELYQDDAGIRRLEDEWSILAVGAVLSLARIESVSGGDGLVDGQAPCMEGDVRSVIANRYERSAVNRRICICKRGCICYVCGLDFSERYGVLGDGFIHVHHVVPVSLIGPGYRIDPETDLVPVCPNCHAMLHRRNPPLLPDELRELLAVRGARGKDE